MAVGAREVAHVRMTRARCGEGSAGSGPAILRCNERQIAKRYSIGLPLILVDYVVL